MPNFLKFKVWRKQKSLRGVIVCDTVCPGHLIPTSFDQKQDAVASTKVPPEMAKISEIIMQG